MIADENFHGPTLEAIVEQLPDKLAADPLIGYPDSEFVSAFVRVLYDEGSFASRLLLDAETERSALDDFLTATKLAEMAGEDLDVRITTNQHSVAVTDGGQVIVPVDIPEQAAGLVDTDEEFVRALTATYEDAWADATPFEPTVPALDVLLEELAATTSDATADDFEAVLAAADSLGRRSDAVGVVTLAILIGARHEELLYDLSEWGEETGVASKATFSRTKSQLEDAALIDTESVPIEVGRPRLRLILDDDDLADADPADFLDIARKRLH